jgi:hypothetical protein
MEQLPGKARQMEALDRHEFDLVIGNSRRPMRRENPLSTL